MIKFIYNSYFIKGNEILFYIYSIIIILIILLTTYIVVKELKNVNKWIT